MRNLRLLILSIILIPTLCFGERLYTAETSGIFVKDKLHVNVFMDPDISGISCYMTFPEKSMSFEDPTNTSIACRKTGKVKGKLITKRNIFSRKKGIWTKILRMDRIYDQKRNVLIYLTYTQKLSGNNASNSISVIVLD